MKLNETLKLFIKSLSTYWIFGIVWVILELIIYKEVQHRVVDDIISIIVYVFIHLMFLYQRERDYLIKTKK